MSQSIEEIADTELSCGIPADTPLGKLIRSQRTWVQPDTATRDRLLEEAKTVAIVGASPNPERPSYTVSEYLQRSSDFRLYFINPHAQEVLGETTFPSLAELTEVPDIFVVFRRASDIPSVVDEVAAIGAKTIWVQLGIWNEQAAQYGEQLGLTVVMDRCIKIEHERYLSSRAQA